MTRAEHLLSDYTTMLRGFCPPDNRCECDMNRSLTELVRDLSCSRCSDEDLLSSADDDTTFIRLLLSRIGSQPLLSDIDLSMDLDPTGSTALVDRDLFLDLIIYIFEDLVGQGATRITLTTERSESGITINIAGNTGPFILTGDTPIKGFLFRLAARAGSVLSLQDADGARSYTMTFAPDR